MQRIFSFIFVFVIFTIMLHAQKSEIGLTMSMFSDNSVARFSSYEDDADYTAGKSVAFGFTYLKPVNSWLDIETGIEFLNCETSVRTIILDSSDNSHLGHTSLINIPIGIRANFLKYCFVNGGVLTDLDVSRDSPISNQTGFGAQLGAGLKFDFKTGISVFVNPYIKCHALIPAFYNGYNLHLLESAIRFGVTYHI